VELDPMTVWGSYQSNGVFISDANYDIPSIWDPFQIMSRINSGDPLLARFTTQALQKTLRENMTVAKAPDEPSNATVSRCNNTDNQVEYMQYF
jgi:hypothetical protein